MKHLKKLEAFALHLLIFLLIPFAGRAQSGAVAPKTGIVKGVLENGITYYILPNDVQPGKVNFYLMQNVGAILEDDNQNGLAHFLEHMAFNGTTNFPGDAIMSEFGAKGMRPSINAHTYQDKTIYHFKDIPTKDVGFTDKCLLILYDWCDNLILAQDKIDSERLVILEEKRTRNDATFRIKEQSDPVLFNNSKYAKRNIIGTEEILKNFKREELVNFYHKWYRTDLQAVVVIGDVDVFQTETKIKRLFSQIKPVETPAERYHITIPDNEGVLFRQIRDVENVTKSISFGYRVDYMENNEGTFQNLLINYMAGARVRELVRNDSINLRNASVVFQQIAYGYAQYGINVVPKRGHDKEAVALVLNMHKDIVDNGFTEEELENAVDFYLSYYKQNAKANGRTTNSNLFDEIEKNFINQLDILDADAKLKAFQTYTKKITLADIQQTIQGYTSKNKSILVIGNETESLLTQKEIEAIEQASVAVQIMPDFNRKEEEKVKKPVLPADVVLPGAKIEKTEKIKALNAEKWTLANGATVLYRENPLQKNVVTVYATSAGGTSVLRDEELVAGSVFNQFVSAFGFEGFTAEELENYYKENQITTSAKLESISEDLFLFSTYASVESLFQMLYCRFERPTFYPEKYKETYKRFDEAIKGSPRNYKNELSEALSYIKLGKEHFMPMSYESFQKLSSETLQKVYHDRYQDASNFTFYIVGGIGKNRAKALAEKYIGSISSTQSGDTYEKVVMDFPEKMLQKKMVFKNPEKKAGVVYNLVMEQKYNTKKALTLSIVSGYLSDKLQRVIRDMEKGTYGVSTRSVSKMVTNTSNEMGFDINFECDPERAEDLNETLLQTLEVIVEMGILPDDFKLIKSNLKKNGMPQKDNMYYVSAIKNYLNFNENDDEADIYNKTLESIDIKFANQFMKELFQGGKILNLVYMTE